MEFTFSEEQEDFRRAVATTLAAEVPPSYVRAMLEDEVGVTAELWSKMAELGWLGVLVPEEAFTIGELRSALAESDIVVVDEQ